MPPALAGACKQTGVFWREAEILVSGAPCHHMGAAQEGHVASALGRTRVPQDEQDPIGGEVVSWGSALSPSWAGSIPVLLGLFS